MECSFGGELISSLPVARAPATRSLTGRCNFDMPHGLVVGSCCGPRASLTRRMRDQRQSLGAGVVPERDKFGASLQGRRWSAFPMERPVNDESTVDGQHDPVDERCV